MRYPKTWVEAFFALIVLLILVVLVIKLLDRI